MRVRSSVRELAFGAAVEGDFGEGVRGMEIVDIVKKQCPISRSQMSESILR